MMKKASTSYEHSQEINSLKHALSEYLRENESFEKKISIIKDDLQKEESRNINRELALEKEAQQMKTNLYDGSVIGKSDVIVVPDSENTLMHAEESRLKMIAKQNDPQLIEKKVITKPIDYATLNQLSTDLNTRFVPQTESYAKQAFWSQYSVQTCKIHVKYRSFHSIKAKSPYDNKWAKKAQGKGGLPKPTLAGPPKGAMEWIV
nr:hypothetical protein [Tanacetum cinerariifolium]